MVFDDSLHGWASSEQDIIMTTIDGGVHWSTQLNKGTDGILDIAFSSSTQGIAVGFGMTIFETTDGGGTWIQSHDGITSLGLTLTAVAFPSPVRSIGLTSNGLVVIAEYGPSGVRSTPSQPTDLAIYPNPISNSGYASFVATETGSTEIALSNILGQTLYRSSVFAQAGRPCQFQIPTSLPSGEYTISVRSFTTVSRANVLLTR